MQKKSVLIADDQDIDIEILKNILRQDYDIHSTTESTKVVELAEQFMPDVILLDIIMYKMTGYEILAELKKSDKVKNIPVILTSALSEEPDKKKGLELGAADYIIKPFDVETIKERVSKQIN